MANTTNTPVKQYTLTGLVVPEEAEILQGVQFDYNEAFGGNLNSDLETPQGQLASSTAAIIAENNSKWLWLLNQINPDYADGFMQDAIARIYFINRKPATYTTVQCQCLGAQGTVIPLNAQAKDTSGNLYLCAQSGVIDITGTITLPFQCSESGAIACPTNTLTTIYQAIPGWDRIDNSQAGVPGTLVESRADFAYRRQNSVALNAHGSLASIYANVFNVPDVIDVYSAENTTASTIFIGATNYALLPHSLYIAAVGGAPAEIGQAILDKKDVGCDTNGNTVVTITDTVNYEYPYPTYEIKYNIPDSLPILFNITIAANNSMPSDVIVRIKAAIVNAFSGGDGGQRARIGVDIYASRFYSPISLIDPTINIISLFIGTVIANINIVQVGIDKFPTVSEADITVTIQ
jgi:uncharacterized phage protein gp47/JayE